MNKAERHNAIVARLRAVDLSNGPQMSEIVAQVRQAVPNASQDEVLIGMEALMSELDENTRVNEAEVAAMRKITTLLAETGAPEGKPVGEWLEHLQSIGHPKASDLAAALAHPHMPKEIEVQMVDVLATARAVLAFQAPFVAWLLGAINQGREEMEDEELNDKFETHLFLRAELDAMMTSLPRTVMHLEALVRTLELTEGDRR